MRIADVLMKGVDGENDDDNNELSERRSILGCCLFTCSSSTTTTSSSSKRSNTLPFSKLNEKRENEFQTRTRKEFAIKPFGSGKFVVGDDNDEMERNSKPLVLLKSKSVNDMVDSSSSSGKHTKDVSFTLGLGAGIAIFTAASKNEFEKMKELRSEVETLIKEVKDEMQRKDVTFEPSDSRDTPISSTASFADVHGMNYHPGSVNCTQSHLLEETKTTMRYDSHINCDTNRKEDWIPGTDQLAAEVEAELERLQLRLDAEEFSEHHHQQWSEEQSVMNNAFEESVSASLGQVEVPDGVEQEDGVCPNELKRRLHESLEERQQDQINWLDFTIESSGSEEVDIRQEAKGEELSYGVSPNILERRLHELLEARQQERIKELEYALELVNQKLRQKDMEVSWWKDIAKFTSQNVSAANHLPR